MAREGRARRLLLVIAVAITAAVTVAVSAVPPVGADPSMSAKASVTPGVQPLNDSIFGTPFRFSIRNTASAGTIGAIEITRASVSQTIGECQTVPSGWTVERTASRCRYRSAPGTADDIAPGQVNNEIQLITNTATGTQNSSGTWSVKVSKKSSFEDLVSATAEAPGLTLTLHSFEVQGLVIDPSGDSAPGAPCPPNDPKPLLPGSSGHAVVACGWNGTRSTLTPTAAQSSLSGSLFAVTGTFQSGPVGPIGSPTEPVVLARWTGAVASTVVSSEHTLTVKVGVDARRTSPVRSSFPYSVFNEAPAVVPAEASTAEGTSTVVELVGTDPESQPLTFSIVSPPQHGSLAPIVPSACTSVPFFGGTCRATVQYTADPGFLGDDSFSYRVNDGVDSSPPAEVSVLVYHPSAPPVNGFAIRVGGPKDDTADALAIDSDGNTIVAGHFAGTVDLDPGPGVRNVSAPLLSEVFLAKYSPDGQLLWGKSFGTTNINGIGDVAVDAAGNIAIVGGASGTVDFGGGPRSGGRFGGSAFVASFTPDGAHRWSFELGDAGPTTGLSAAFDGAGNLVAGGFFTGLVDFDPGAGSTVLGGGLNGYVAKYASDGALVWVVQNVGNGPSAMEVGPSGEILATGQFRGTMDFDTGPGVTQFTSASFLNDAFMVKLDAAGVLTWARQLGAFPHESADDVAVDANGDALITGFFSGTVDLDPGPGTVQRTSPGVSSRYLLKLTASGDFVWVDVFDGGPQLLDLDASGNVVATGTFGGAVDFDPGAGVTSLTARGAFDVPVASYSGVTGDLLWARAIGGPGADGAAGVVVMPDGTLRLAGVDQAGSDFDPGPDVYDRPGFGLGDVFLVELDSLGRLT